MRNPPVLSILFFALVPLIFALGIVERGRTPRVAGERSTDVEATTRDERIRLAAARWPTSPRYDFYFNALNPSSSGGMMRQSLFDPADDYWGLPREPGYEEVAIYCGSCHSLSIVMQQRASRERWAALLDWMVNKQGMAPLFPEDKRAGSVLLKRAVQRLMMVSAQSSRDSSHSSSQ